MEMQELTSVANPLSPVIIVLEDRAHKLAKVNAILLSVRAPVGAMRYI
jgi:hypothetical protein